MPLPKGIKALERTEKWHKKRAAGIGGSDWSAILSSQFPDEHKYGCIRRLFLQKTGAPPDFPRATSQAAKRGQLTEGLVAEIFRAEHGILYVGYRPVAKELFEGTPLPEWWGGTPDRVFIESKMKEAVLEENPDILAILEIKTMMREMYFKYLEEGPPDYYKLQPQHYMARTGLENSYLAIYWPDGAGFQVEAYPRDNETLQLMLDAGNYFWDLVTNNNIPDRCPLTDERCGECEFRKTCRPGHYDGHVPNEAVDLDITPWAPPIMERLLAVKDQIKELEKQEDELSSQLKAALETNGDIEIATCMGHNVKFEKSMGKKTDTDGLWENHPEIMRQFTAAVPRRTLYIRKMVKKK